MMTPALSPVHYLLVDDLEENLLALEGLLRRPDLVLLRARSGTEALELLLKYDVALALIDVQMPVMDGFELAELMRGTERTRRVPIIFLTAGSSDSQRRFRGYETGAVDFLLKPIEPDVLRSKAAVFFELYRQRQEVARQRDDLKVASEQIRDLLTESERQAAALIEADHRKDEFLAMLAHELRNPLAPIRSAVDVLRLLPIHNADLESTRQIISRQVSHMTRLIDDLLDVARIARGKISLQQEALDLGELTRRTTEDLRATLEVRGLTLQTEITTQQMLVAGDAVRLAQVLGNLLHNAGKFTPSGGAVTVRAGIDEHENCAFVSVEDTGMGMQPELIPRLFEPFYQANQALDRKLGGLGLGLALVKGIVDLHGGAISAASPGLNAGSTFMIRMPLQADSRDTVDRPSAATESESPSLRILLIEDNSDAAVSLQKLLGLMGHYVNYCVDGTSGLEQLHHDHPDVVISDLGLPGDLNGFEIAKAIRSDLQLSHVHLIALSGYGHEEDQRKALAVGYNQFLVKPVAMHDLAAALEQGSRPGSARPSHLKG